MTTNSENRQRVRMFTLEEVIKKVINIDSDNESLANALELMLSFTCFSDVSSDNEDDEDNVTPEVTRCSVKCLESALDETNYNECESLFLWNIVSILADDVVYEWTQGHLARQVSWNVKSYFIPLFWKLYCVW